ncbi:hypothetical protein LEMLEM_LOCUS23579 [Lemmus lemmus]
MEWNCRPLREKVLASSERLTNNYEPVYPLGHMASVKMSVPVTRSGGPPGRDRLRHECHLYNSCSSFGSLEMMLPQGVPRCPH